MKDEYIPILNMLMRFRESYEHGCCAGINCIGCVMDTDEHGKTGRCQLTQLYDKIIQLEERIKNE